ncbi:protein ARV1 [Culicoides brevitarsis]|uniref:protein ARV1 n=1 Tax=Culicoides brevitarsis TaxID=469753 RepID=UPI00307B47CC
MLLQRINSIISRVKQQRSAETRNYVCINCGFPVKELIKKYSSTVVKINHCDNCNEVADKYIEFETIIILIDLILLSKAAYRHVIFNTESKNLWKLAVVIVLLESYVTFNDNVNRAPQYSINDPFLSEKGFYLACAQIILGNILLYFFIVLLSAPSRGLLYINSQNHSLYRSKLNFAINLMRGITLASIGKFFFLPIMIWRENSTENALIVHLSLVIIYFILSLIHAHSVIANCSRLASIFIVIFSYVSETYIMTELSLYARGQLF